MDLNALTQLITLCGVPAAMYFYHMKTTNELLQKQNDMLLENAKTLAANTEVIRANGELIRSVLTVVKEIHNAE